MTAAILIQTLVSLATLQLTVINTPSVEPFHPQITEEVLSASSTSIPTLTPTPTEMPEFITYVAKSGDTIRKIAKDHYGSEVYWVQIWNDNEDLEDPALIHPGLELTLRTAKQTEAEELARALPTPIPTATPTPELTETKEIAQIESVGQTGSPIGNFAKAYEDAGNKYGIPWQILSAIHQVETGRRDGPISNGSGPHGPMQFMPGTWAVHGVDGDGDGDTDINDAVDAIHSAANYLSKFPTIEQGLDAYGRIREDVMNIAQSLGYTQ